MLAATLSPNTGANVARHAAAENHHPIARKRRGPRGRDSPRQVERRLGGALRPLRCEAPRRRRPRPRPQGRRRPQPARPAAPSPHAQAARRRDAAAAASSSAARPRSVGGEARRAAAAEGDRLPVGRAGERHRKRPAPRRGSTLAWPGRARRRHHRGRRRRPGRRTRAMPPLGEPRAAATTAAPAEPSQRSSVQTLSTQRQASPNAPPARPRRMTKPP